MGGDGLRHVVHRRVHKERPQPSHRKHFGYLEKHKDYVKRAKDYHEKQDKLKKLHRKAFFRNDEEFAFAMMSTKQQKDGSLAEQAPKLSNEEILLLNSQDSKYITMREQIDRHAIEKQAKGLHFLNSNAAKGKHTLFLDDEDLSAAQAPTSSSSSSSSSRRKEAKLKGFDVAKHFDTHRALLKQRSNRLRSKQLKTQKVVDEAEVEEATKNSYQQLVERQERAKKLANIASHLELRRNLRRKGRRMKVSAGKNGMPDVYRWDPERKK